MRVRGMTAAAFAVLMVLAWCGTAGAAGVKPLPQSFLWGVSSSGFQSEGHTTRANWNAYIARDGTKDAYGDSVDFYDHYASDIALAAKLGVTTYRISINWTRVEPRPGVFSQAGLRFYDRVLAKMKHYGIQPLITLNHWDYPQWVGAQGGWTNHKTVDDFLAMTRVIVQRYAAQTRYWLTFNEELFYEYVEQGEFPLRADQVPTMRTNMIDAHRRAYDLIHRLDRDALVSTNYAWPGRGALSSLETDPFMKAVAGKLDYAALDYYYPAYDQVASLLNIQAGTPWLAPLDPFGIYTALRSMHRMYPKIPVLVTENGMGTKDGGPRPDGVTRQESLKDTVYWVQRARAAGVPVIGYLYWSLTDNYEWGTYTSRFGLYRVDVKTDPSLRRRPTAAVPVFRRVVRARGVPGAFTPAEKPAAADCATASVAPPDRAACRAAVG
ncbi:MAG: glycoside hydrolase family 1, partial [Conexibacter sp.]|nr:glycoside hydrolase family 1 [Conexibacter sp.]